MQDAVVKAHSSLRWFSIVPALAAVAIATAIPLRSEAFKPLVPPPECTVPAEIIRLDHSLMRTARRLATDKSLTVVAIGSSSTGGAFASSPAASYPSRLAVELRARLPGQVIHVVNQGANGEDAREMLARFQKSVMDQNPDLVLWQVGTNSLLLDRPLVPAGALIREGLARLKEARLDVVLIDAQYAPKLLGKPDVGKLMELYGAIAKQDHVDCSIASR